MSDLPTEPSKTVLVVDDSASIRTLFRIYLRRLPVEVLFAQDGVEALEIIRKTPPDLILLDLMMPRMDGWTLLDRINASEDTCPIPRIIISSRQDAESLQNTLEKGVTGYLVKPVSIEQLLPMILEVLETGTFSLDGPTHR